MFLLQDGQQLIARAGTIVSNAVLVAVQIMDAVYQLLRIHALQFLLAQDIGSIVLRAPLCIDSQACKVLRLVQLGICPTFQLVVHQVDISFLVHLCIGQQLLEEGYCLRHVLVQSCQHDVSALAARRYGEGAGHAVEFLFHLFGCHVARTQVFQILCGHTQRLVVAAAHVEEVYQLEEVVRCILAVDDRNIRLCLQLRQVLGEVEEHRFDRLHLAGLNLFQEGADRITVHHDRCDLRFLNLLFVGVFALTLVDDGAVVILQILVGKSHDVLLCQLRHAVKGSHLVGPIASVDERLYKPVGTCIVAFQLIELVELEVVDVGLQHFLVKVAVAQLLQLAQQQVFHLVQRLSCLRSSGHQESTVVAHTHGVAISAQGLLLLHQVKVNKSGLPVIQYL